MKEKHGGEVVVLCAGPARAAQTIREALAKGADRAIHIEEENLNALDTLGVAKLLAAAAKAGESRSDPDRPAIGRSGLRANRRGGGRTAGRAALDHHHAGGSATDRSIRVKRELEDGWFQHIAMPLPAVLTIQSGINKLRYATLMGIKKAKTKEIKRVTPAELGGAAAATAVIEKIYVPQKSKQTQIFEGDAKTAAAQAGGETEVRSAGHMSVLVDSRTAGRQVASHVVGDAGGGAAVRRGAGCAGGSRGRRRGHRRAGGRSGDEEARESLRGRARSAEGLHRRRIHAALEAADPQDAVRRWCCFRTPIRCATSRRSSRRDSRRCWSAT